MSGVKIESSGDSFDLLDMISKADNGDVKAMHAVIAYIAMEDENEQDLNEKRVEYINKLIDSGDKTALIMLAGCYKDGKGVPKDTNKAMEMYQEAADAGIKFGYECIGQMYFSGDGIKVDYEKAYEYYSKNFDELCPESAFHIGEMYRKGLFLEQDDDEAIEMYDSILEMKYACYDDYYPLAIYRLAEYTLKGFDTGYDLEWAKKAVEYVKDRVKKPYVLSGEEILTVEMIDELWLRAFRELIEIE